MKTHGLLEISHRISSNDQWLAHCARLHQEESVRIGQIARTIREEAKISARALAKSMGISAVFLCDIERGRRGWSDLTLGKWLSAMSKLLRTADAEPAGAPVRSES